MLQILLFVALVFGFLAWLAYVAYRDPAGIFKPKPRPPQDDGPADGR